MTLRRDTPKSRAWASKRSKLNPQSAKKLAALEEERRVREAVFHRDGYTCQLKAAANEHDDVPLCWGMLTFHHLLKASAGGPYTEENGATLCVGHNQWVEDAPERAAELGMVRR